MAGSIIEYIFAICHAICHMLVFHILWVFDCVSDTSRTLFRTHGGFQLFTDNAAIIG